MNTDLIDSRRSVAESRALGMECECEREVRRTADGSEVCVYCRVFFFRCDSVVWMRHTQMSRCSALCIYFSSMQICARAG